MRRTTALVPLALLALLTPALAAQGPRRPPIELVLSRIERVVSRSAEGDRFHVSWLAPGIPFAADAFDFATRGLDGGDDGEQARRVSRHAKDFAFAVNQIPLPEGVVTEEVREETAEESRKRHREKHRQAREGAGKPQGPLLKRFEASGQLVWDVYSLALNYSKVAAKAPDVDKRDEERLAELRKILVETKKRRVPVDDESAELAEGETPSGDHPVKPQKFTLVEVDEDSHQVQEYEKFQTIYNQLRWEHAQKQLEAAATDTPAAKKAWDQLDQLYQAKIKDALAKWKTNGHKDDVERARREKNQIEARGPLRWKSALLSAFDANQRIDVNSGTEYYPTIPVPSDFASTDGWTHFAFDEAVDKPVEKVADPPPSGWREKARAALSALKLKLSGKGKAQKELTTSRFKISFDMTQVLLDRPWFEMTFLTSRRWKMEESAPSGAGTVLSNGKVPPEGLMPLIPVTAIFIRNLRIDFDELHAPDSPVAKELLENGAASIGPFALPAAARDAQGSGISASGMQLVALKCLYFREPVPNPDPSIEVWK